ncbi:MAG: NPCBM/NEW2 domain-containing protein [Pseudonocardiaceae bacterium]
MFNIERKLDRFQAIICLDDEAPIDAATRFVVIVDRKEVYRRDLRLGDQGLVDISVTNGLRLVLRLENIDTQCSSMAVWGDAGLGPLGSVPARCHNSYGILGQA